MSAKGRILIVDDEKDIRFLLREILEDEGYDVSDAAHSEAAYADIAAKGMPDLVILDIWLENSDRDGMEILGDLKKRSKSLPVLMISGHGNIEMAVKAIKLGAYDFIEKPFNTDKLLALVARVFTQNNPAQTIGVSARKVDFVTVSADMQVTIKAAQKAASGDARVLVTGVWGSGRTHLARYIHQESSRSGRGLTVLHASNLDSKILSAALAQEGGGVVIRDIEQLPAAMQAELLAGLNSKKDVRVMATAGDVIDAMRADGRFMPDLYERLAVVRIAMPPLQSRLADMSDMCLSFISSRFALWGISSKPRIEGVAADALKRMVFDGQAAEFEAFCHGLAARMAVSGQDVITARMIQGGGLDDVEARVDDRWLDTDLRTARDAFERWYIEAIMARFDGNVSQAAAYAGMERTAFHRKLKALREGAESEAA